MVFLYKGGQIGYSDLGKGEVIVLLHGYLESSDIWNGFRDKLAFSCRVISIDLPGHGKSDIYAETHSMEFMAAAVKNLLDEAGVKKAFIAGHSLGGYVTLAFLEHYPEYLSGYCLFHSQPFADSDEAIDKRLREISIVRAGKKELMYPDNVTRMFAGSNLEKYNEALDRSKAIASLISGEGIIAVLKGMIERPDRSSFMEAGKVPCLWILGSMDNYIACDNIRKLVKLPSNAEIVVLEHSGHMGFIEEEDTSVKVVLEFIRKL